MKKCHYSTWSNQQRFPAQSWSSLPGWCCSFDEAAQQLVLLSETTILPPQESKTVKDLFNLFTELVFLSIPLINVKYTEVRIFVCEQWGPSVCEVYVQETHENLDLFFPAGGDGGAERQLLSGQGRVLLGLQSPAWGNKEQPVTVNSTAC